MYIDDTQNSPMQVLPPSSTRKYWTRRALAEWFVQRLGEHQPTLVGIDHGFSFPLMYFERHGLPHDWPASLKDGPGFVPFGATGLIIRSALSVTEAARDPYFVNASHQRLELVRHPDSRIIHVLPTGITDDISFEEPSQVARDR